MPLPKVPAAAGNAQEVQMRTRNARHAAHVFWLAVLALVLAGPGGCADDEATSSSVDASAELACVDEDGDGFAVGPGCGEQDCDDANPDAHPNAPELCGNGKDDDCDGETDEGFENEGAECWVGDGICRAQGRLVCARPAPELQCDAQPGEPEEERCNGLDDDCNGLVDDTLACRCLEGEVQSCWPGPAEARGRGECMDGEQTCSATGTWGECVGAVLPAAEVCDGRDNDCNGLTDDVDEDGDTYWACPGVAERDCDDENPQVHPGALELCNGRDDNCNGLVDEQVLHVYYLDRDGDGYGSDGANVSACEKPQGYADVPGDCNDSNPAIHPGAQEVCNDADDDCNGLIDDGLPLLDIYPDNDGDGYAAPGTTPRQKCDVPLGWATAKDPDGDGVPDWDCNDSDVTVHPAAAPLCDGKDNDCDGYVDRWCAAACGGNWPVGVGGSGSPDVAVGDMDQDNTMEVGLGNGVGGVLVEHDGSELWRGSGSANYLRQAGLFADVDFSGRDSRKRLEWVAGVASQMTFFRIEADGTVSVRTYTGNDVYDSGSYVARDLDGDGRAEILAMRWSGTIDVYAYNETTDLLEPVASLEPPDNGYIYTNGFALADVNGDGEPDLVFGTGHAQPTTPSRWSGHIYAFTYDPVARTFTDACPDCYPTEIPQLYSGSVPEVLVHDLDGDGTAELLADVSYFSSNTPGVQNPSAGWQNWVFDGGAGTVESGPSQGSFGLWLDLDGDGTPEEIGRSRWYADVDGDGDYDSVAIRNGYPVLVFREGTSTTDGPKGVRMAGSVQWLGDLDNDGRLDVLISQPGQVDCVEFGDDTWHPWKVWTPMRGPRFYRTGLLDGAEPNEDEAHAFALAVDGWMRGYIQNSGDVDWYKLFAYCPRVTIQAPSGLDLHVRVYRNGSTELFAETTVAADQQASLSCTDHPSIPHVFWMYVEIQGEGGAADPRDPYVLRFKASF